MTSRAAILLSGLLCAGGAHAAEIDLVGVFPGKAVLVVDGGVPRAYAAGATIAPGVRLVSVEGEQAVIDNNGRRSTISLGNHNNRMAPSGNASVTLTANSHGHFYANLQVNGGSLRAMVDTGATMIAMPASDARRIGIDYKRGRPGFVNTANGPAPVYVVRLDTVRVGDIQINGVDAVVQESGLPIVLLGMSFLNRVEMQRNGEQMTLTKRF